MRMRIRLVLILLLSFLGHPLHAADRESTFLQWSQSELIPWFDSQPDQFLTSQAPSARPVKLRYKTFLQPMPKANIVIVHGYGERIEKFMEMAYDFHAADYNVYLLDQRGFGRSTRLNPEGKDSIYVENFQDYAQDLAQFLQEVVQAPTKGVPTFLFAHSMGGLVSTLLIHDHPELVQAAVLSAPMLSIQTHGVPQLMVRLLTSVADGLGYGASYALGQIGPRKPEFTAWSATQSRARWQLYADFYSSPAEWPASQGGTSFHWLGEAVRATRLIEDDAWTSQVQTPILLFQADQDTYVTAEGQDNLCSHARACRKVFVPGSRHEIYREQDAVRSPYMRALFQFLDEQVKAH